MTYPLVSRTAASRVSIYFEGLTVPLSLTTYTQDIASAAVYLASDAAVWVTGKTLEIDGGLLFAARQI
jgi:NAD(P)-dependent dehydrogenase (short-subunit alcohol dehydrogenase family)